MIEIFLQKYFGLEIYGQFRMYAIIYNVLSLMINIKEYTISSIDGENPHLNKV